MDTWNNTRILFYMMTVTTLHSSLLILFLLLSRALMNITSKKFTYVLWVLFLVWFPSPISFHGIYAILPDWFEDNIISFEGKLSTLCVHAIENSKNSTFGKLCVSVFFIIYTIGFISCLFYAIFHLLKCKRKFKDAIHVRDNIYKTDLIENALVFGFIKPKIYVNPYLLEKDELAFVLKHEQYHIKRRDYLVKPLAFCILAILWFNPLVWLSFHAMMKDMEISCDEEVMKNASLEDKKIYSYFLLNSAIKSDIKFWQTPNIGGSVGQRVKHIMNAKKPSAGQKIAGAIVLIISLLFACSSPKQNISPTTKAPVTYDEQMISTHFDAKNYGLPGKNPFESQVSFITLDDEIITLASEPEIKNNIYQIGKIGAAKISNDTLVPVTEQWLSDLNDYAQNHQMYWQTYSTRFCNDGYLYLSFAKYNKPFSVKSEENQNLKMTKWVTLKIDLKTNTFTEVPLPELNLNSANPFRVVKAFKDGQLFVTDSIDDHLVHGVYDQDGSLVYQLHENYNTEAIIGNDYYAFTSKDDDVARSELLIDQFDEKTGNRKNQVSFGPTTEWTDLLYPIVFSYQNGILYSFAQNGIYQAKDTETQATVVVDAKANNYYELGNANDIPINLFYKDGCFYGVYEKDATSNDNLFFKYSPK